MQRLPEYLKRPIIDTDKTKTVRRILKNKCLNTVCEGARCPNKSECYSRNTATFLIMGNVCTRNCRYCNISTARPEILDSTEPQRVADAIKELKLKYAVITSVTRDDLVDGGAQHFCNCIEEIRKISDAKIEILTPDFCSKGKFNQDALDLIIKSHPNVFNHNIETAKGLFKIARPQGNYDNSLRVLGYIKENSNIITKSGMMIGLGEDFEQIEETFCDLKNVGVDIITVGQYIQPSKQHLSVQKFYSLEEFDNIKLLAKKIGFQNAQIGPLVRSSYQAMKSWQECL